MRKCEYGVAPCPSDVEAATAGPGMDQISINIFVSFCSSLCQYHFAEMLFSSVLSKQRSASTMQLIFQPTWLQISKRSGTDSAPTPMPAKIKTLAHLRIVSSLRDFISCSFSWGRAGGVLLLLLPHRIPLP